LAALLELLGELKAAWEVLKDLKKVIEELCSNSVSIQRACRHIPVGQKREFQAQGSPAGGTYQWTLPKNISPVGPTNQARVTVRGSKEPSQAVDDCRLQVTYTWKDQESGTDRTATDSIQLTVVQVEKIQATVPATPSATADRKGMGREGQTPVEDPHQARISDLKDESYPPPPEQTLILMTGRLQDVVLEAVCHPKGVRLGWDVKRYDGDAAELKRSPLPRVDPQVLFPERAVLRNNNGTGLFFIRAFTCCGPVSQFEPDESFVVMPLLLVNATLQIDNTEAHKNYVDLTVEGNSLEMATGEAEFDINRPDKAAIYLKATARVTSGGPDGRLFLPSDPNFEHAEISAGWINNVVDKPDAKGTYRGNAHQHYYSLVLARDKKPGQPPVYLPGETPPGIMEMPLLDTGRKPAGYGGQTAILSRARIDSAPSSTGMGENWIIRAVDSPGAGAPLVHPHPGFEAPDAPGATLDSSFPGVPPQTRPRKTRARARIEHYHYEIHFRAYLCFWTRAPGGKQTAAYCAYAVLRSLDWKVVGDWTVDAQGRPTRQGDLRVEISNQGTHAPLREAHQVGCEVWAPPSALQSIVYDATR
jgi:hypothetical protein